MKHVKNNNMREKGDTVLFKFNILNKAQEIGLYMIDITIKMPKKYRIDIINKLRETPFNIIHIINEINSLEIDGEKATIQSIQQRLDLHKKLITEINDLDSFLLLCFNDRHHLINRAQLVHATSLTYKFYEMVEKWADSDRQRGESWINNIKTE